jgi:hypothetical protein
MHYNAAIGKSFYEVPYTKEEDLSTLKELCTKINSVVNVIIATDKNITNEKALLLALINITFEANAIENNKNSDNKYTSNDIMEIISAIHRSISHISK